MSPPVANYETSTRSFPSLLQHWRKALKYTHKQAAAALGVPHSTFEGWLAGRDCGKEATMRKLMERLSIEARG